MSYIKTYSGKRFDYLFPESNTYNFEEIAHALSLEQRFSNHLLQKWSVGQHVLLVHQLGIKLDSNITDSTAKWLIHHDDMEAYFKDIPTPLKELIPDYKAIYNRHEEHYQKNVLKLDIELVNMGCVKKYDYLALIYEDLLFGPNCNFKFHDWTLESLHTYYASLPLRYIQKLMLMNEKQVEETLIRTYNKYELNTTVTENKLL